LSKTDHQRTVAAAVVLAHARAHGAAVEALENGPMSTCWDTRALQAVHMAMADEYTRSAKQLLGGK